MNNKYETKVSCPKCKSIQFIDLKYGGWTGSCFYCSHWFSIIEPFDKFVVRKFPKYWLKNEKNKSLL